MEDMPTVQLIKVRGTIFLDRKPSILSSSYKIVDNRELHNYTGISIKALLPEFLVQKRSC